MEIRNAPVTAKRSRKRRSDAIYPDGAARQRAYRARRKAAREAQLIAALNKVRDERGLPPLRGRPNATFYGLYGNLAKKVRKQERERVDAMNREEYIAYLLNLERR